MRTFTKKAAIGLTALGLAFRAMAMQLVLKGRAFCSSTFELGFL